MSEGVGGEVVGAVAKVLAELRKFPLWVLVALTAADLLVLYLPPVTGLDISSIRVTWRSQLSIAAVVISALTLARAIDLAWSWLLSFWNNEQAKRVLRLIPRLQLPESGWQVGKQPDGSTITFIRLIIDVTNPLDQPIRLLRARIIRPRVETANRFRSSVTVQDNGIGHSDSVPPGSWAVCIYFNVGSSLGVLGTPIDLRVGLTDQSGHEYVLKRLRLQSLQRPEPDRVIELRSTIKADGRFESINLILNEEQRSYAANGRIRGGLGSLNTTLQSEPNFGWTLMGSIPTLLWDKAQATRLASPNADAFFKFYDALDHSKKVAIKDYLLSLLNRDSQYADVGYFVFFLLHRMGMTIDALNAARTHLAGDEPLIDYDNLLGTLSALISREHFDMAPDLFPQILEAINGDASRFRLAEKVNLARLLTDQPD